MLDHLAIFKSIDAPPPSHQKIYSEIDEWSFWSVSSRLFLDLGSGIFDL